MPGPAPPVPRRAPGRRAPPTPTRKDGPAPAQQPAARQPIVNASDRRPPPHVPGRRDAPPAPTSSRRPPPRAPQRSDGTQSGQRNVSGDPPTQETVAAPQRAEEATPASHASRPSSQPRASSVPVTIPKRPVSTSRPMSKALKRLSGRPMSLRRVRCRDRNCRFETVFTLLCCNCNSRVSTSKAKSSLALWTAT